jgi:hypothetical protein
MKAIQITRYEAFDGTIHETVDECLRHEGLNALESFIEGSVEWEMQRGAWSAANIMARHADKFVELLKPFTVKEAPHPQPTASWKFAQEGFPVDVPLISIMAQRPPLGAYVFVVGKSGYKTFGGRWCGFATLVSDDITPDAYVWLDVTGTRLSDHGFIPMEWAPIRK